MSRSQHEELTAWGRWLSSQPYGTRERAHLETGLAQTTIDAAKTRLVKLETAELLSEFSGGAVTIEEMRLPKRRLRRPTKRKAAAA